MDDVQGHVSKVLGKVPHCMQFRSHVIQGELINWLGGRSQMWGVRVSIQIGSL